jgi:hypothetical protein
MRALYALTTIEGRVADLLLEGAAMQDVSQKLRRLCTSFATLL